MKKFVLVILSLFLPLFLVAIVTIPLTIVYWIGAYLGGEWFFPEWGLWVIPFLSMFVVAKGYGKVIKRFGIRPLFPWWVPAALFLTIILAWAAVDLVLDIIHNSGSITPY